jgi:hypothetical protein
MALRDPLTKAGPSSRVPATAAGARSGQQPQVFARPAMFLTSTVMAAAESSCRGRHRDGLRLQRVRTSPIGQRRRPGAATSHNHMQIVLPTSGGAPVLSPQG